MTTLDAAMVYVRGRFLRAGIEEPAAEARIIVGGLLSLERTDFITRGNAHLAPEDESRIRDAVERRIDGEPPYRILGRRSFYGLEFGLSQATLEPRPDTEILVDAVLEELKGREDEPLLILDLGTGTGAICQALLSRLPDARGVGSDLSPDALATAKENAAINGLADRFEVRQSDWFENISGAYDVIVSNPPYIASKVIPLLDREVRDFDPHLALDGGDDGLDAYRAIAANARPFLKENGLIAVETGFDQRHSVEEIFRKSGFRVIAARKDYGGNDRVQIFREQ
jgi:release factor glutamine methyltransferase